MNYFFDPQGFLTLESKLVTVREARPVLNGVELTNARSEVLQNDPEHKKVCYHSPELGQGSFYLEVRKDGDVIELRYWLEDAPPALDLYSFGLRFAAVENLRLYLRNGYFSWDGSFYVQPESLSDFESDEERPEVGYAVTQLLPHHAEGSVVIGFDRHDRFQQSFTFDTRQQPSSLTVTTFWDHKDRATLSRCESERLIIFDHHEVEEALCVWARRVAQASPTPPRLSTPPINGWCSWYNLYGYITEENILHHLRSVEKIVEMGDWLEVKPQFPRGMKPVLDDIQAAGFTLGLWIAPFMVGNRSRLYAEHRDWVVKDKITGGPLIQMKFYGEFRWHKRSEEYYILDTTHPEAFDYLRRVFRVWRNEWGCEYFKTDFMHFGCAHGSERAMWHTPGMTRIEVWRRVAEMIRVEIGEAVWVGCGCPLWASVGLVDGVRIGRDVGVEWGGDLSAQSLLRDQSTRNFANHILWQIDPDCVLLRQRYHNLTDHEVRSLALYAGMSGGVMMTSDDLAEITSERLRLWKMILPTQRRHCRFPFLGKADIVYDRFAADGNLYRVRHKPRSLDPVLVQVRYMPQTLRAVIFLFNTGDVSVRRSYSLTSLGVSSPSYVYDPLAIVSGSIVMDMVAVSLAPHDGVLLFLAPQPIGETPETLEFR
ncbi:MAG: alpha-galactosidase [Chloroflexi bacterium]|nr:alpha-galactosidase [Chloroflexota bacterium]